MPILDKRAIEPARKTDAPQLETENKQLLVPTGSGYGGTVEMQSGGATLNTIVRVDLICCHLVRLTCIDNAQHTYRHPTDSIRRLSQTLKRLQCLVTDTSQTLPQQSTVTRLYLIWLVWQEADMVHEILDPLEEVLTVNVSVIERQAYVKHNASLTPQKIVALINAKHLGASLAEAGRAGEVDTDWTREQIIAVAKGVLQTALFTTGLFLMFSTGDCTGHSDGDHCDNGWSGIGGDGDSLVGLSSPDLNRNEVAANLLWICSILLSHELFYHAYLACLRMRLNVEFLMSIAVIGTIIQGDFLAGALVCLIVMIMDAVKHQAFMLVERRLKLMITVQPATVQLLPTKVDGVIQPGETIEITELKLGMEFRIREGEMIPSDGLVLAGSNVTVDEKQITGEATPVPKMKGSSVMSGALVNSGFLDIRATALPDESFQGSVAAAVSRAKNTRSATQVAVSRLAYYYTPCVIIIAILVAVIEWDLEKFLVILVAGCPCGLLGAAPLVHGTSIALLASEKYRLLVKNAEAMEGMAHIVAIGLDKTGTITEGQFQLLNLCGFDEGGNILMDYTPTEQGGDLTTLRNLLMWASCVETGDNHPIARSIVQNKDNVQLAIQRAFYQHGARLVP